MKIYSPKVCSQNILNEGPHSQPKISLQHLLQKELDEEPINLSLDDIEDAKNDY